MPLPLDYSNRPDKRPRWLRILRWIAWRYWRGLLSLIFGAYPGER